jgi:hypothetical protein
MPKPKRKKDPQTYALIETTEDLLDLLEMYREELETRMEDLRAQSAPSERITELENLITKTKALEDLVDLDVWDLVRNIANGSAYVEHARTGDYF